MADFTRPFTNDDLGFYEAIFSDQEVCRYYCLEKRAPRKRRDEWLIHRKWQAKGSR